MGVERRRGDDDGLGSNDTGFGHVDLPSIRDPLNI